MLQLNVAHRGVFLAAAFCFFVLGSASAQDQQSAPASDAAYRGELHALAGRILKRADKAKCHPNSCIILVANFTTPTGSTSRFGIQLADSISAELLAQGKGIQIVDRSRLREYLVREHIPSNSLKEREPARWLATEFQANAVLLGTIEQLGDHFNLLTELLSISNDNVGPQEAMQISIPEPQDSFAPFEPYDEERPRATVTPEHPSASVRAGANGTSIPECIYCPPPQYTNAARKVKFNGTVVLLVTVMEDGQASDISVLKGVPFSLNEAAIKAVSMWKFKPATNGERPVSVSVPIETTYRLN